MKMDKQQLEKLVLAIVAGFIIVIVLVTLVFKPRLKRLRTLRADIREQQEKVKEAEETIFGLARLKMNIKRLTGQIELYQSEMPEMSPDWLLGRLNTLASDTGLDFNKIEPQGTLVRKGPYSLQGVRLELNADYHSLGKFINQLENSSDFLQVLDLSIVRNEENIKQHRIELVIGAFVPEEK